MKRGLVGGDCNLKPKWVWLRREGESRPTPLSCVHLINFSIFLIDFINMIILIDRNYIGETIQHVLYF